MYPAKVETKSVATRLQDEGAVAADRLRQALAAATIVWETNMKNVVLWVLGVPVTVLIVMNVLGVL
jgi:hypothetical protein